MIGIIFDCDGTLVDSEYAHFLSWQAALKKRGVALNMEGFFSLSGNSGAYIAEKFLKQFNLDSVEAILADKREVYHELHKKGIAPIERTVNFVKQLALLKEEKGLKLGVASAAVKEEILLNLKNLGISEVFDVIVSGKDDLIHYRDPEGVNKPKPYIYLHTAKLLGLNPADCVAFEDSGPGVLSASRAGLVTFAVPNSFTMRHDLSPASYRIEQDEEIDLEDFFQKIGR